MKILQSPFEIIHTVFRLPQNPIVNQGFQGSRFKIPYPQLKKILFGIGKFHCTLRIQCLPLFKIPDNEKRCPLYPPGYSIACEDIDPYQEKDPEDDLHVF